MENEREELTQKEVLANEETANVDIFDDAEVVDIAFTIHEPRPR